jgi:hypothetical protein
MQACNAGWLAMSFAVKAMGVAADVSSGIDRTATVGK